MADDVKIKVEGLRETNRVLKQIGDVDAVAAVKKANLEAAQAIVDAALPNVPVGSSKYDKNPGALKRSVKALAGVASSRMKAGGIKAVPYAPAVHWGTGPRAGEKGPHNIKRRAFLWDAREKLAREVVARYESELDAIIDKATRGS